MIKRDQPTCFPPNVIVHVSSRDNGSMLDRSLANRHDQAIVTNRETFCREAGIDYKACTYQIINYADDTPFDTIVEVTQPNLDGVMADVLYTATPGIGLFLPVADCVGTILYDPRCQAIAIAHLGRHASIAKTMTKAVEFFTQKGSDPKNLIVWMAPSVDKESYKMQYFDYRDDPDWRNFAISHGGHIHLNLSGFNRQLAINAGVAPENIHVSNIDTAKDSNYFSHSQGDKTERFAVVAMLSD